MIIQLLRLKYYQLRRQWGYWIPLFGLGLFFISDYISSSSDRNAVVYFAVILLYIIYHFQNRKDWSFIEKHLSRPAWQVVMLYTVIILPASSAFVINKKFLLALILHMAAILVPFFFRVTFTVRTNFRIKIIPAVEFEWISGLRRTIFFFIPLVLIAIVLSPVKFFGLAALLLLNLVIAGFYSINEPLMMLNPFRFSIEEFLKSKINFCLKASIILNLPLLTVNSIVHPEQFYINVLFIIGICILHATIILIKYANYEPRTSLPTNADTIIVTISLFVPWLLPLSGLIFLNNRKKAINNLRRYL